MSYNLAKFPKPIQLPNPVELAKKYIPTKVEFPAPDGLTVSDNLYEVDKNKPVMHQAGYNRIEYAYIAPKLNKILVKVAMRGYCVYTRPLPTS